jgi:hypothetical protein
LKFPLVKAVERIDVLLGVPRLPLDPGELGVELGPRDRSERVLHAGPGGLREFEVAGRPPLSEHFGESEGIPVVGDRVDQFHLEQVRDDALVATVGQFGNRFPVDGNIPFKQSFGVGSQRIPVGHPFPLIGSWNRLPYTVA